MLKERSWRPSQSLVGIWNLCGWGGAACCHYGRCPLQGSAVGEGVPRCEVLALLAFVFSLQVSERGDDGEAKLKFLFEKLTTSKLKDSYL